MDNTSDEELRHLRSRAYGPGADIAEDPAALRRLRELEAMRRAVYSTPADDDALGAASRVEPRGDEESTDPVAAEGENATATGLMVPASDGEEVPPRIRTRLSRGRRLLWTACMLASAVFAATVTFVLIWMAPVETSAGAPQIASLTPAPGAALPPGWFGAAPDLPVFEFYGLTIFESAESFGGENPTSSECILVVRTDQVPPAEEFDASVGWSFDGQLRSGCRVGAFPANVGVPFDGTIPEELRERYPKGVALQFVLDGDRVGVFLDSE